MSVIGLSKLLTSGKEADLPIALRGNEVLTFERLRMEVAGVATRARADGLRRAALVCQGSYAFCVGLLGLLYAKCEVSLPPNGLPDTLRSLNSHFDQLVDDRFIANSGTAAYEYAPLDTTVRNLSFFTSGSTGIPKRISKSVDQLECEVATLDRLWGENRGTGPAFSTVSHQHVYGLSFKVLWPLATARPFADETDELWETLLDRLRPDSTIVSSPAHLERLGGLSPLASDRYPAKIFSAGAPLSLRAALDTESIFGRRPTEIFGSTETGAFATRTQDEAGQQPWRPLPGIETRCDDDGRLMLRSPYVQDGWFETSDLVEPTKDGFHFRGRADRVVKIEGKRISLVELEQTLVQLPWITAAAAILLPDTPPRLGAAVVLNDLGHEKLDEMGRFRFGRLLRSALTSSQEAAGRPRIWRFVAELPSPGAMGKRRDEDLLALFENMA